MYSFIISLLLERGRRKIKERKKEWKDESLRGRMKSKSSYSKV
jgi:hypothetical protein